MRQEGYPLGRIGKEDFIFSFSPSIRSMKSIEGYGEVGFIYFVQGRVKLA